MPRDLTTLFADEVSNTEQTQLYHLISFIDIPTPGSPTTLTVVDSNSDVTYDGVTYIKFPISFSGVEMTSAGEINKATLVVANPDRMFQPYIAQYKGLRGLRVKVLTVFDKFVDTGTNPDPDAAIVDEFIIDSYSSQFETITFSLDPVCDFNVQVSRRRFTQLCYWRFKDPDTCAYAGTDTACSKDLDACRHKNNASRFGGFPGIPTTTRRISF